jgi:LAS superfamily LD-carboxypeptidase LdcB
MILRWMAAASTFALLAACDEAGDVHISVFGDEMKVEQRQPAGAPSETFARPTAALTGPESESTSEAAPGPTSEPLSQPASGPAPAPAPDDPPAQDGQPAPGHVSLNYLMGKVDPAKDPAFARIPEEYLGGTRVWGHKDAVAAFVRMAEAAAVNGYKLKVVSAFRSFDDQKQIWEDKWNGKTLVDGRKLPSSTPDPKARALKILEFSSMPGTSRHHWGTDFDLNSLQNSYFKTRDGKRIYDWLVAHAPDYGFCQVYSDKTGGRTGYEEEKWHWSYMPIASWYLKQYPVDVGYERLNGFEGSQSAKNIDVIKNYVQGINPDCQ